MLLALWMYRKLPLAPGPPRPAPVAHRVTGFALFAVTVRWPGDSRVKWRVPGRGGADGGYQVPWLAVFEQGTSQYRNLAEPGA